jgi:selenium donor protein
MVAPLTRLAGVDARVLVGPETGDDAGVYRLDGHALISTADFITPVCDDPLRFGRVAAANSVSDVYAMGGRPLFALNLCCFPGSGVPDGVLGQILRGAAETLAECDAVVVGGHTVEDPELKYGLAVIGRGEERRLLTNAGARPGDRLILTKPLGTGVLVNAFKFDKLDQEGLEPALVEMERLNAEASELALTHRVGAATDVTGFGLAGHALNIARGSGVRLRIAFDRLIVHDPFYELVRKGISTGCTEANRADAKDRYHESRSLTDEQREVLFDPQTSGGLLLSIAEERAGLLLQELIDRGHRAAEIGEVVEGPQAFEVI